MTSTRILILVMLPLLAYSICQTKTNSVTIYPKELESYKWDLRNNFFLGPQLTFALSSQSVPFGIQKPIVQIQAPVAHFEAVNQILAIRARTQNKQRAWLNQFAFIEKDGDTIDLFYSTESQANSNYPPNFSKKINILSGSSNINCYNLDYLDADTWLVDCADTTKRPIVNKFLKVNKAGNVTIINNDNLNEYTFVSKRLLKIQIHTTGFGKENQYVYRAVPAYSTNFAGLDQQSILEVFRVNSDGTLTEPYILDYVTLGLLLGVQDPKYFKFSLVDFQVFPDGKIYVMDALNGLFVLTLQGNGEFKLLDRIVTNEDQVYGFDIDNLIQEDGTTKLVYTILYNNYAVIKIQGQNQKAYSVPFVSSYPSNLYITQEFVVVQNRGITYLYSIYEEELVHREAIDGPKIYLVNPFETEMIGITALDSRRYTLSHGYLTYASASKTTSLKSFTIIATDPDKNTCSVSINYQILDNQDYNVYDLDDPTFPSLIRDFPDPFDLNAFSSGPNLKYAQLETLEADPAVNTKIISIWDLQVRGVVLPVATSVIYSDVLVIKNELKFFQLLQSNDKVVQIYDCESQSRYTSVVDCVLEDKFTTAARLSRATFAWWTQFDQIYYLIVEKDTSLAIYTSDGGKSGLVKKIDYPSTTEYKITSIEYLKDRFFVVLGNRKEIHIYQAAVPFTEVYVLTEIIIKGLGFTGNWSPAKIYGNRAHKSYLFFIINKDNVVVADYHIEVSLVKTVPCLANAEIEAAIGIDSFIIVQKTASLDLIQEYDLINLSEIRLIKTLPLYWYQLQSPLQVDFASDTGDVFIRAFDNKSQQTVLLVYTTLSLAHDSLNQVVGLNKYVPNQQEIIFSSAGNSQMFVYLNNGATHKILSFLKKPLLIVQPSYDVQQYYTLSNIRFQISNYVDSNIRLFSRRINLINTQTVLQIDDNKIANYEVRAKPSVDSFVPLGNTWYDGSVLEIDVDCQQCDELIKIIQSVHEVQVSSYNKQNFLDASETVGHRSVLQAETRVVILDSQGEQEFTYAVVLSTNKFDSCAYIEVSESGTYMFSACYINGNPVIVTSKCEIISDKMQCFVIGQPKALIGVTKFARIGVVGQSLIVLNANQNDPKSFETSLNIYTITISDDSVDFVNLKIIGKSFFNNGQIPYLACFTVQSFVVSGKNYIKIFITDVVQGVFIIDGSIDAAGALVLISTFEQVSLYQSISEQGQYVTLLTRFYQVGQAAPAAYDGTKNTLTSTILFTTSNTASYAFQFVFNTATVQTGAKIISKKIVFILNQYGDWTSLNKLTCKNGFAIIPYTNTVQTVLVSYQIPVVFGDKPYLARAHGGIFSTFAYPQATDFFTFINLRDNIPILIANVRYDQQFLITPVAQYQLLPDYYAEIFNKQNKVISQPLFIYIKNSFTVDGAQTKLVIADFEENKSD